MPYIACDLDVSNALARLKAIQERMGNVRPLYHSVGEYLLVQVRERFDTTEASPQGTKWKPLSRRYRRWKERVKPGGKILSLRGTGRPAGSTEAGAGQEGAREAELRPNAARRPGHGRNGSAAYKGATRIPIPHRSQSKGQGCPGCQKGKVYPQREPGTLVRILGMEPLNAILYETERPRCNLCGEVFEAEVSPEIGQEKYDHSAGQPC